MRGSPVIGFLGWTLTTASLWGQLPVGEIPWPDYELSRYSVSRRDGTTKYRGEVNIEIARGENRGVDSYRFMVVRSEQSTEGGRSLRVSSTNYVNVEALKPLVTEIQVLPGAERRLANIVYHGTEAKVMINSPTRRVDTVVELPPATVDAQQLLVSVRAFPLKPGFEVVLPAMSPDLVDDREPWVEEHRIKVTGEEELKTELGKFKTYKVEIRNLPDDFILEAWYQKDGPRRLLKYTIPRQLFIAEIVEEVTE